MTLYYSNTREIESGALIFEGPKILFDHLPQTGYALSPILEEDTMHTRRILKGYPIPYKEAVFFDAKREFLFANLKTGEAKLATAEWAVTLGGYGHKFIIHFNDGEEKSFSAKEYGKDYVFMDPWEK